MKKLILLLTLVLLSFPLVAADEIVNVPIIGEVLVDEMPLLLSTIMIAAADGFNPCSIWVLLFLLGIILHTGSRKTIALVGLTFLLVTSVVYGLFIVGIFNIFTFMQHTSWIIYIVVALAVGFGLVNIKDYFWYKKGLSFTIPDKYKPKYFKNVRDLMKHETLPAMLLATAVLAAGVAIVELPCTAGLPFIWSGLILSANVGLSYYLYLLLYLLVYLAIEIIILVTVLITLKSFKMDEFKGRVLKLFSGLLILVLGLVLLFDQTLMYNATSAFLVIVGSVALGFIILFVHYLFRRFKK